MPINITTTVHNAGPDTIWAKLAQRLGREPTNAEASEEVRRILREGRRFAFTPETCPSKHWNDGTDHCADCGAFLG